MKKQLLGFVFLWFVLTLCMHGCADIKSGQQVAGIDVYRGTVIAKSNKAKLLSLEIGNGDKSKIVPIRFDDQTKGLEYSATRYKVIIRYEKRNGENYALSLKPELSQIPSGVTVISVDDVKVLIEKREVFELIDSRPAARYSASHLPGAISIPVPQMKDLQGMLPEDKDTLLIFYCGGPV